MTNNFSINFEEPASEKHIQGEILRLKAKTLNLTILVFCVIGVILGYFLFGSIFKPPFTKVSYAKVSPTEVSVEAKTRFPARAKIEYGTNSTYVNSASLTDGFDTTHSGSVAGLLPGKEHLFRVVAEDNFGRTYYSNFYSVN